MTTAFAKMRGEPHTRVLGERGCDGSTGPALPPGANPGGFIRQIPGFTPGQAYANSAIFRDPWAYGSPFFFNPYRFYNNPFFNPYYPGYYGYGYGYPYYGLGYGMGGYGGSAGMMYGMVNLGGGGYGNAGGAAAAGGGGGGGGANQAPNQAANPGRPAAGGLGAVLGAAGVPMSAQGIDWPLVLLTLPGGKHLREKIDGEFLVAAEQAASGNQGERFLVRLKQASRELQAVARASMPAPYSPPSAAYH